MITWDGVAVWVLQAIGAVGAIWGLFASETSRKVEGTGRRTLTGRGRFALFGVMLGLSGFALNQYKDKQRSDAEKIRIAADLGRAEEIRGNTKLQIRLLELEARLESERAGAAKSQLDLVTLSQDRIADSQNSLIFSQRSQIRFLTGLAMVQQELSGMELSWPQEGALGNKISRHLRSVMAERKIDPAGDDVYFEICLSYGDLIMTRRPNYAWQVACSVSRPQGMRSVRFEVPAGDWRASLIDAFLDDLLSPNLLIQNSRGDVLLEANVGSRPIRVERLSGNFRIELEVPRTRFSTLEDRDFSIRMDTQDLGSLPKLIRIKSRDPLARFDTQWRPEWQMKTIGSVTVQREADMDPEQVDVTAAVAPVRGFRVSFDGLLRPSAPTGR